MPASLEDLLVRALDCLEREGAAGVERLLAQHPAEAPRLRAHLERLHRMGLAGGDAAPAQHPERLGDFRIVAPLGQGGMGVVYRAVQESLGREVALKLIRPDHLFFPGARERFRREVETVARMQHPGIVPIHAVGNHEGVPYFAMELVRGATLADVVARLAGTPPSALDGAALDAALAACTGDGESRALAEPFRGTWVEIVLRIVREAAEALEHAHRRGVLHRDVKPSNIMLTRDGRVLLLDFGLAGGDTDERLTRTGSPLGSLAYMPPEVLAGAPGVRGAALRDERGDVYSLGVTCWELLTLRLPYQESDPLRVRELAGTASRPRLSTLNRAVTWDVETVVATAMDPDPARRYASASLLSRDLDNLLAHRPIEAREPGAWLRLQRWTQRHPARATALGAVFVALIGAPTLWAIQEGYARQVSEKQSRALARVNELLERRNDELDRAKATAEAESTRATANFAKLQRAVDTMLTKVGDESLKDVPRMELVRRDLLGEALRFYEGFLTEHPDDPRLRTEAARVRLRVAEIHALLGEHARAGDEVAAVVAALDEPGSLDAEARRDLARARTRLATARRLGADLPGAAAAAAAAIAAWAALPAGDVEVLRGLGEAHIEASLVAADRGDLAGAFAQLEAPLATLAERRTTRPGEAQLLHLEARMLHRAAIWAFQDGAQKRDRASGAPLVERAVELHRRARELWPRVAERDGAAARSDEAQGGVSLCLALQRLGRRQEASETMAATMPLLEQLAVDFPHSQRRRSELANARTNYAALLGQLERRDECARQLELAQATWSELVKEAPTNDDFALGLAHVLHTRATLLFYGGDADGAAPLFTEAGAITDRALAIRPDNPTYRRVRRKVWESLAEVALAGGDHAAAVAAARGLLLPELAPTEPLLAAALIARCIPLAPSEALAAEVRIEARGLLQAELDRGTTVADWRRNPSLGGQWDKPGFRELIADLERADR